MKRIISTLLTLCFILSMVAIMPDNDLFIKADAALSVSGGTLNSATFIIDPGHGGSDPGACLGSRAEADDVLRLSLRVAQLINANGSSCALTRVTDVTQSLATKASIANSGSFSYFVSIHRNAGGGVGIENYYHSNLSSTSTAAKLCTAIHNSMINSGVWTANRGVKTADYYVLRETNMAATLLEVGFIDSTVDNSIFDTHFETIATSIANGMLSMVGLSVASDKVAPTISNVSISNVTTSSYRVSCTVSDNKGVTSVSFPTWTDSNGQDDLVWHTGTISGSTAYYDVKISEHGNEQGLYHTHIYAYDAAGNQASAQAPSTDLTADTTKPTVSNYVIENVDYWGFDVRCNVSDNKGVTAVQMPTWTSYASQDDIVWYNASVSNGVATLHVNTADHNGEYGTYNVHVYAWDAWSNVATAEMSVVVPTLAYPTDSDYLSITAINASQYTASSQIWTTGTFTAKYWGVLVLEPYGSGYTVKEKLDGGADKSVVASTTNPIIAVHPDITDAYAAFQSVQVGAEVSLDGVSIAKGSVLSKAHLKIPFSFVLTDNSTYALDETYVTTSSSAGTSSIDIANEFKCDVKLFSASGAQLDDNAICGTGCIVKYLSSAGTVLASATVIVPGDLTGDGAVNATDLLTAKNIVSGSSESAELLTKATDLNGDALASSSDLLVLFAHCDGSTPLK